MNVQRGVYTLGGGGSVTLSTPVPVGKSFVISSVKGYDFWGSTLVGAYLSTAVDGYWTQITFTRSMMSGTIYVEWQVIYDDDVLSVQQGATDMTSTTVNVAISEVDRSKTFVVISFKGTQGSYGVSAASNLMRATLTSDTNLQFDKNSADWYISYPVVYWYVVTWEGASVQSGDLYTASATTMTGAISAIDLAKSFLIYSYTGSYQYQPACNIWRGHFSATTQVYFQRGGGGSGRAAYLTYFVVTAQEISVQRGVSSFSGTSSTIAISSVDLDKSFTTHPSIGNGYNVTTTNRLQRGIASQKLNSPIELIMARADGTFNYYYSYFVVTWVVTIPTKVYYWTGNESVKVNSIKCWSGVAWDEVVAVWAWVESVWEQVWGA
jgi:hypothetical protein